MKIIRSNIIPFKGFNAINVFGLLVARRDSKIGDITINHEKIHTAQMKELLYIFFYLWYVIEFIARLIQFGKWHLAYKHISFEREAYTYQYDYNYSQTRKRFAFTNFIIC